MIVLFLIVVLQSVYLIVSGSLRIGVGIYDVTGPAVEVNFMGYAVPEQRGTGIHIRLRARTFLVSDSESGKFVAYVNVDGGLGPDIVKQKVLEALNTKIGVSQSVFTSENLLISVTHTHSGPAGYLQYVLYQMTSIGFVKETFDSWVTGITESIYMAYMNQREKGTIRLNQNKLVDASINRSPTSYMLNPEEERIQYADGDRDLDSTLLSFSDSSGDVFGLFHWFAVHGTSMNNTNTLISGDNKGYAAYLMEKELNGASALPGLGPRVAAFAQSNMGDISPNTAGPICIDTGLACDKGTSTCNGKSEMCIASGPGEDMFESTKIIGHKQFKSAMSLLENTDSGEIISGPLDFRHSFVKMEGLEVKFSSGKASKRLCNAAMGYSFAAGTTDGPGMFNFTQGENAPKTSNIFWNRVRDFITVPPTPEDIECQRPKPILLNVGDATQPYSWTPSIVPIQILRIGNFFILGVPGEFTTMASRRLKSAVYDILKLHDVTKGLPIQIQIAGLSNTYADYITTYEEYQAQRYEGASTIFGPHTLDGYIQEFSRLATDLALGQISTSLDSTQNLLQQQIELMPKPLFDATYPLSDFGDIRKGYDVKKEYRKGQTVSATFHSANPRNNQRTQSTFLTVEKKNELTHNYSILFTDGDWETKFHWFNVYDDKIDANALPYSFATITWDIAKEKESYTYSTNIISAGTYRICHFGDSKNILGDIKAFSGCTSDFAVI